MDALQLAVVDGMQVVFGSRMGAKSPPSTDMLANATSGRALWKELK